MVKDRTTKLHWVLIKELDFNIWSYVGSIEFSDYSVSVLREEGESVNVS